MSRGIPIWHTHGDSVNTNRTKMLFKEGKEMCSIGNVVVYQPAHVQTLTVRYFLVATNNFK